MSECKQMGESYIAKMVRPIVDRVVTETIEREMPRIVERKLVSLFQAKPNVELTEIGFSWAFYLALKERWPDVKIAQTSKWLRDYQWAEYGEAGYDWTASGARELAREYVSDFGEAA